MDTAQLKAQISILPITWNGWRNADTPQNLQEKEIREVKEGELVELKNFGNHVLQIQKIDQGSILISSADLDVEGVSTNQVTQPEPHEVTLKIGETVKYKTSTLDSGCNWEINLVAVTPVVDNQVADTPVSPVSPEIKTEESSSRELPPLPKPDPGNQEKPKVKVNMPKINWDLTQNIIKKLEENYNSKVIAYYVSLFFSMRKDQADIFFEHLKKIGYQKNLILFLFGPGGDPTAALRIATILREYCESLTILIPSCSASAATILSLAADKIIMSSAGYLTAIDSSLNSSLNPRGLDGKPVSISIEQIKRIIGFLDREGPAMSEDKQSMGTYRSLFKYVHPLVVAEISRNSSLSELIAIKVMRMHPDVFSGEEHIKEIARKLINDYPTHAFPILYQEAKDIGLPVEKSDRELSELMWELVKLYDSVTQVRTTNFSPTYQHYEEFPVIVETAGFRTFYRVTLNKRFNPVLKRNDVENNLSGWFNITPADTPTGFKVSTLDLPATSPAPKPAGEPIPPVPAAPIKTAETPTDKKFTSPQESSEDQKEEKLEEEYNF